MISDSSSSESEPDTSSSPPRKPREIPYASAIAETPAPQGYNNSGHGAAGAAGAAAGGANPMVSPGFTLSHPQYTANALPTGPASVPPAQVPVPHAQLQHQYQYQPYGSQLQQPQPPQQPPSAAGQHAPPMYHDLAYQQHHQPPPQHYGLQTTRAVPRCL